MLQASGSLNLIPQVLALSDDGAIESILSDIPFFSVGLLAFGVFTFFFVMRRVDVLSIYLYGSVLVAFVAAILDLSQLLSIGNAQQQGQVTATSQAAMLGSLNDLTSPLVITREIGFSLAIGLRFMFFWLFVARCPWGEKAQKSPKPSFLGYDPINVKHSASWARWGLFGIILKIMLLKIAVAIAILNLIWRLVGSLRNTGPVYLVDATLEIVASALFIVKLLLNVLITPVRPTLRVLRFYLVPIAALIVNIGVPVGNLISFAFSETTLGRFLQAVELYALILFVLITSFFGMRESIDARIETTEDRGISSEAFTGLPQPRYSTFKVVAPPMGQRGPSPENRGGPPRMESRRSTSRESTASRISAWLDRQIARRRSIEGDKDRLWSRDQAERGQSPIEKTNDAQFSAYSPSEPPQQGTFKDPISTRTDAGEGHPYAPYAQPPQSAFSIDSRDEPRRFSIRQPRKSAASQPRQPTLSQFSLSSYYTDKRTNPAPDVPELTIPPITPSRAGATDSPVYGLNGIMAKLPPLSTLAQPATQPPTQPGTTRNSASSIDELLRQQRELDKSIAALRLFSPRDSGTAFGTLQTRAQEEQGVGRQSTTTTTEKNSRSSGMESGSMRSDFSLSNFPTPPLPNTQLPPPTLPSTTDLRPKRNHGRQVSFAEDLAPPRMPAASAEPPSLPGTLKSMDLTRPTRFDSSGTQYDVTSFIGGLTGPRSTGKPSIERMADIISDDGGSVQSENTAVISTAQQSSAVRPMVVASGLNSANASREQASLLLPPATASSGLVTGANAAEDGIMARSQVAAPMPLPSQGGLASQAAPAYVPPAATTLMPPPRGSSKPGPNKQQGLPSRPRLAISGPRPPPESGEPSSTAYERPRPPPLILNQGKVKTTSPTGRTQAGAF